MRNGAPRSRSPVGGKGPAVKYGIDKNEVLRYLGYAGQPIDSALRARLDAVIEGVEDGLQPKFAARRFAVEVHSGAEHPYVDVVGAALELEGADIAHHLDGATGCVLMACTLGARSEQELARLAAVNPLDAVIYDAACSALVERVADAVEARIVAEAAECGLQTNWRYSPGYGDLPLSAQPRLLSVLKAYEMIGLSVTDDDLLLPTKSITAIVGLFAGPPPNSAPRTCATCGLREHCSIRKTGKVCHG